MFQNLRALTKSEKKKIAKGLRSIVGWIVIGVVFAIFSGIISGCQRKEPAKIYEVHTSGITYQTSEMNKRIKEPVVTETVYWIVGGE